MYKQLTTLFSPLFPLPFPLLFTNTSTIAIGELAAAAPDPGRFCGFHFFHPVRERSLVEIIPGRSTNPTTIAVARNHAEKIGKKPIVVGDGPGFLVNRLLHPYLNGSLALLEEGVPLEWIEQVATEFGMLKGPFRIMDEIGLDVTLHGGWVLSRAFPERAVESKILVEMVARGLHGRKTGAGFFLYDSPTNWGDTGAVNREFITTFIKNHRNAAREEIVDRLFHGMYLEALRCVEDGVVQHLDEASFAAIHGLGFPAEGFGPRFQKAASPSLLPK